MPRLHCQQKNRHETNTSQIAEQHQIYYGTRRLIGSGHTTETAFIKWLPTHCHEDGRLLTLPFCLPDTRHNSKNSGTMYNWGIDTTLLPTNRNFTDKGHSSDRR